MLLTQFSCVGPGMLTDGSSVSVGTHARGALRRGALLPLRGDGYVVPSRWAERRRNFGTDELVTLLRRVARGVRRHHRRSTLGIADLSPRGGGATPEHGSHRSGRDVDLLYYATDLRGRPVVPVAMVYFDASGQSVEPKPRRAKSTTLPTASAPASQPQPVLPQRLDRARNWALVRGLVTDPEVPVQWIFMGRIITRQLLRYAKRKGESKQLIERAALVLRQPGDASPHTDHMHVRVFCDQADRHQGCIDRGPARFLKKSIKYLDEPRPTPRLSRKLLERLSLYPFRYPLL